MLFYRSRPVPKNVWIGCSIGEKSRLWRLEQLRKIEAKIRFVSFEPLLEDLGEFSLEGIAMNMKFNEETFDAIVFLGAAITHFSIDEFAFVSKEAFRVRDSPEYHVELSSLA